VTTLTQRKLLALCALRHEDAAPDWTVLARVAQLAGGLDLLYQGHIPEDSRDARKTLPILQAGLRDLTDACQRVDRELEAAERYGARLTTVMDDDYPANLRLVPNLPPFLFYRGALRAGDTYSIAVVGTRQASDDGRAHAADMAHELSGRGVRICSGLARGIDAAAHTATLDAHGRTLAVIGTGITKCYPPEHRGLAERIVQCDGAVLSQFWPTSSAAKWSFPRRNITMSGLSQATCVIEASSTSGAKMQARAAFEHGKQVFLLASLVKAQPWAAKMLADGKAVEVDSVTTILERMAQPNRIAAVAAGRMQLALDLFPEERAGAPCE
jgi:DNA processing protein